MRKRKMLLAVVVLFILAYCTQAASIEVVFATEGISFGSVAIDNPTGEPVIQYDVQTEVKKGDTIAFNIDFNFPDKVSINILADGLIKCYEQEYETWEGKNTITYKSEQDMRYFTIYVNYHGQNLSQRMCEISNIRLSQDNKTGETAVHVDDEKKAGDTINKKRDTSAYILIGLILMLVAVLSVVVFGTMLVVKNRRSRGESC